VLATLKVEPESITWDRWEALQKEYGSRTQLDILADIGLGKRLSFVVAQALTRAAGKTDSGAAGTSAQPSALTLRGVEGVAIQYAKCCRPIPGDRVIGQFRKGQGLAVHLLDCVTLKKQRADAEQLVDVDWAPDVEGVFDAGIRVLVADRRGLLADLATSIADAQGNIDNVSMERPDGAGLIAMFFSVQVRDRRHLAHIMRGMKRVEGVRRVQRTKT
jgi:GTP pyrophosphokinase